MTSLPWMPLNVADYLADTAHLGPAEHGAYLLLIMHYWQHGGLPDNDRRLARIARMSEEEWVGVRDTIAEFFREGWQHKRIDQELADAYDLTAKRSAAGKAGASARYGKRMANAEQAHGKRMPRAGSGKGTTSEDTPSVQEEASPREVSPPAEPLPPSTPEPACRMEFSMTFWPAYPHKVGRPAALRAFIAKRQEASLAEIMNGLARYKSDRPPDRQWLNPETFLNDERFRDEPAPARVPNGAKSTGHDAILRSLARQASEGDPAGEWPPGPPVGHDDFGEGAPADFGAGDGLPRPALAGPR